MLSRPDWRSVLLSVDWRFIAVWLATLTLIWTSYAFAHRAVVDSMQRNLLERLETDTLVLEDHASRALDGIVSRMEAVAELSADLELVERRKFSQRLRDLLFDDTMVRSLSLVDGQGFVVVSSNLSNIGQKVSPAVLDGMGPRASPPRKGVQFSSAPAQRDLAEPPMQRLVSSSAQSMWLGQIDARNPDLVGHRWVVVINSGFFQNFWAAAVAQEGFQVGLFSYSGQALVSLGQGPAASAQVASGIQAALRRQEKGEVTSDALRDWTIRYRASARHALAFVMFINQNVQAQQHQERTANLRWLAWGGSLLASVVVGLFYLSARRYHRFAWANKQLRQQVHADALTGIANRRAFDELVPQELTRASALGLPLSLMVMDLDQFKSVNDQHGHAAGDAVLQEMGRRWQALLRSHDLVARIGGDEFCVVLPGAGPRQAEIVALKLLEATRQEAVAVPGVGTPLTVSTSIGLLGFDACPEGMDMATLVGIADGALYRAKGSGRNQGVAASLHGDQREPIKYRYFGMAKPEASPRADKEWLHPDLSPQTPDHAREIRSNRQSIDS